MTVGERIKFLREINEFTQKDVADRLGLEPAAISKYELNLREPNVEAIKKLSEIFEVSIDYLLGNEVDINEQRRIIDKNEKREHKLLISGEVEYLFEGHDYTTQEKIERVKEFIKNMQLYLEHEKEQLNYLQSDELNRLLRADRIEDINRNLVYYNEKLTGLKKGLKKLKESI